MKQHESLALVGAGRSCCVHLGGSADEPTQSMMTYLSLSSPLPSDLLHYDTCKHFTFHC